MIGLRQFDNEKLYNLLQPIRLQTKHNLADCRGVAAIFCLPIYKKNLSIFLKKKLNFSIIIISIEAVSERKKLLLYRIYLTNFVFTDA